MPEPPLQMRLLPRDANGYVYPWFVDKNPQTGELDHRIASRVKVHLALDHRLCWVCGLPLGSKRQTFVIGPMCLINRTTSEPGGHRQCATYSAKVCPWMASPKRKRRPFDPDAQLQAPPGQGIARNPGVAVLFVTRDWVLQTVDRRIPGAQPGSLIRLGEPEDLEFFAEGRPATRNEVQASIESGLPILRKVAREQSRESEQVLEQLVRRTYDELDRYLPA